MNKPKEIEVKSLYEFQDLVDNKHFSISQAIVSSILNNVKTRKKNVHVLSIKCTEENTVFDITLEKTNFIETLKDITKNSTIIKMDIEGAEITVIENMIENNIFPKYLLVEWYIYRWCFWLKHNTSSTKFKYLVYWTIQWWTIHFKC